ncbi:hypothetical protein K490DRAFT_68765 [Saccharata proteae CBS 121410]|uniref:Uncharacterized protein n=1 Tax=Saccharata proteae CBS 121410 TaxID=1314787 RepID=A0A9P4HPC7_9PEZI|nr:hypothetical protein K490DRAFT_68765 [Saccharata proteae CBS 121410]
MLDGKKDQTVNDSSESQPVTRSLPEDDQEEVSLQEEVHEDELWELDEAQSEIANETPTENHAAAAVKDEDALSRFPMDSSNPSVTGRLSLSVILPQRRPKDRNRGFIRAYAPVLQECGIDQATWINFFDAFNKSTAADPRLNAINLASIGGFFLPAGAGIPVGWAINSMARISLQLDGRYKTAKALEKVNNDFFRPRGFCRVEQVGISRVIAAPSTNKFRSSDAKTQGLPFSAVAPLVFPTLDQLAAMTGADAEQKKQVARHMGFVMSYWDRRATAEFQFRSRYADPSIHASNGSLISFLSGGKLVPGPKSRGLVGGLVSVASQAARGEKQGEEWGEWDRRERERERKRRIGMGEEGWGRRSKKGNRVANRVLFREASSVLYLTLVNLPTAS